MQRLFFISFFLVGIFFSFTSFVNAGYSDYNGQFCWINDNAAGEAIKPLPGTCLNKSDCDALGSSFKSADLDECGGNSSPYGCCYDTSKEVKIIKGITCQVTEAKGSSIEPISGTCQTNEDCGAIGSNYKTTLSATCDGDPAVNYNCCYDITKEVPAGGGSTAEPLVGTVCTNFGVDGICKANCDSGEQGVADSDCEGNKCCTPAPTVAGGIGDYCTETATGVQGGCQPSANCTSEGGKVGSSNTCNSGLICCYDDPAATGGSSNNGGGSTSGGSGSSCTADVAMIDGMCFTEGQCTGDGSGDVLGTSGECNTGLGCCYSPAVAGGGEGSSSGASTCASYKGLCKKDPCPTGTTGYELLDCTTKGLAKCCVSSGSSSTGGPSGDNGQGNGGLGQGNGAGQTGGGIPGGASCPGGTMRSGICFPATGLPSAPISVLLMTLMNWLLAIFGFVAIGAFVVSGLQYMLAAGNEDMAETAKHNMQYSMIGVAVGLSGYVILSAISNFLNASPWF